MPALGSLDPPLSRFGIILLRALSVGVHHTYGCLSGNVALLSGLQRVFECQRGLAPQITPAFAEKIHRLLRAVICA